MICVVIIGHLTLANNNTLIIVANFNRCIMVISVLLKYFAKAILKESKSCY